MERVKGQVRETDPGYLEAALCPPTSIDIGGEERESTQLSLTEENDRHRCTEHYYR